MQKTLLTLIALAALACAGQVQAADATAPTPTTTPQQNRMKSCAAQYHQKNIAKSQYHSFMSQCLKTQPASATKAAAAAKK